MSAEPLPEEFPAIAEGSRARFTVIVPTLNEAENIDELITQIMHFAGPSLAEVIVVDDGSTDGTRELVQRWEHHSPVRLLCRDFDRGLAGAVVAGAHLAHTEIVVVIDADLSHPPESLPFLVAPIVDGSRDMVIGSRYVPGGSTPGWPALRRAASRGAAFLAWPLTDLHDALSGFFAVRRDRISMIGTRVAGFKIGLELILRGAPSLRVSEIPITFCDRQKGASKMTGHVILNYLQQLLGFASARVRRLTPLSILALTLWTIALLVVFTRSSLLPSRNTVFATYTMAGKHWSEGLPIYSTAFGGFVYSPLTAAFFAPFAMLPSALANILWRGMNVIAFTGAIWWWLRRGLHPFIDRHRFGLVFLLLLPLALGNINNGQVNPLIIALLMLSIIGAATARWTFAAICIAFAVYFKVYPVVLGLLLIVLYPRQFAWRFVAAIALLGLVAFLFQRPAYVAEQYRDWIVTRLQDNRHLYKDRLAPRDLWLLLRTLHVPISAFAYQLLQVGTGLSIALYAFFYRRLRPAMEVLVMTFTLAVTWMLLLGPASESATYVILAPVVVLTLINAQPAHLPLWFQAALLVSLALLLLALGVNSFTHSNRAPLAMILQPLAGTIFFLVLCAEALRSQGFGLALPLPTSPHIPAIGDMRHA